MAMAKFYPGTITFNDGSTKTGVVEIPSFSSQKLKFRSEEKADTEKLSIDDIKKFTVTLEKNESTYFALNLASIKPFKREYKIEKKKSWVRLLVSGNGLNIMELYSSAYDAGGIAPPSPASMSYFFWKPENNYCNYFHTEFGVKGIGVFKALKQHIELNFEKECPEMAEKLEKEKFNERFMEYIMDLYNQNCGSTK
jgi:hypothetical protein